VFGVLFEMCLGQRFKFPQPPFVRITGHHIFPVLPDQALFISVIELKRLIQTHLQGQEKVSVRICMHFTPAPFAHLALAQSISIIRVGYDDGPCIVHLQGGGVE